MTTSPEPMTKVCTCGKEMHVTRYGDNWYDSDDITCYMTRPFWYRLSRGVHCAKCDRYHKLASFKNQ